MSAPSLELILALGAECCFWLTPFWYFVGEVRFGHPTAVVGASKSSSSSSTEASDSLEAADRLHSEMENPGALREVSKVPVTVLTGLIFHFEAIGDFLLIPVLNRGTGVHIS